MAASRNRANITDMVSTRRRVKPAPPPAWIKPQLAAHVDKAPDGPDWLHEIKFDGYRMHARLDAGRAQILTRRGKDWTEKYPGIDKAIAGLPARSERAYFARMSSAMIRPVTAFSAQRVR